MQLDPILTFVIPILEIAAIAVFVLVLVFMLYSHRKGVKTKVMHWWRMARGKHAADDYLVYESDDWDKANAPRKRKKANRIDNLLLASIMFGPYAGLGVYFIAPALFTLIAAVLVLIPVSSQVWKYLRVLAEVRIYSGTLNLRIFYQTLDGREGEVVLERCRLSDRITVLPRELVRSLEAAEHVIRSGVDERVLMAKIGKDYLTPELKQKLDELETLSSSRETETREALKSVFVLRKYFSAGQDDAELQALFDAEVNAVLAQIRALLEKKEKKTDVATVVSAFITWRENAPATIEKLKKGDVTNEIRPVLEGLEEEARKGDETAKALFGQLDVVKRFYTLGVLRLPGEKDDIARYEPHIYTVYPRQGDIKRRCVVVFPVPFGEAVKRDSTVMLRFDYTVQDVSGTDLEAIRLDETLQELIVQGTTKHGIKVTLPEGLFAATTEVPIFIVTRCDSTEEQMRQAMRITAPPALIGLFVKAVHSIIDHSWLAEKLAKAYGRIRQLEESRDEDKAIAETEKTAQDLALGSLIEPTPPPQTPVVGKKAERWQVGLGFVLGLVVGIVSTIIYLRYIGLLLLP